MQMALLNDGLGNPNASGISDPYDPRLHVGSPLEEVSTM
jgi:hypothetical protein